MAWQAPSPAQPRPRPPPQIVSPEVQARLANMVLDGVQELVRPLLFFVLLGYFCLLWGGGIGLDVAIAQGLYGRAPGPCCRGRAPRRAAPAARLPACLACLLHSAERSKPQRPITTR
jgi:hypothetical protein